MNIGRREMRKQYGPNAKFMLELSYVEAYEVLNALIALEQKLRVRKGVSKPNMLHVTERKALYNRLRKQSKAFYHPEWEDIND